MAHELTEETIDAVIFCMENQNEDFLFDTKELRCVTARASSERDEWLIPLPEWTAAHGFALMEEFAGSVKNPELQKSLREAMATRAGVFKRFKAVLAEWPEFELGWRAFKRGRLRGVVLEWFSAFLQAESLASLGEEPEETAEIVQSDFALLQKDASGNLRLALEALAEGLCAEEACARAGIAPSSFEAILVQGAAEVRGALPKAAGSASLVLFARLLSGDGEMTLFCAETAPGEKAAVLLAERVGAGGRDALVLLAATVLPAFRGMGLFSQLLEAASSLAETESRAFLCAMPSLHSFLRPELERAKAFLCFAPLSY